MKKEVKVKICGLRGEEDVQMINRARPDYAGFILAKGYKRTVEREQMRKMKCLLDPDIPAVGVFVGDTAEEIAEWTREGLIDVIQLHGYGSNEEIRRLQEMTGKPVIRAYKVMGAEDVEQAQKSSADLILLDGGSGQGERFDWSLIRDVQRPYMLAGGLTPDNVPEALQSLHPYGIDISSGVETDGWKDERKIIQLMKEI